jgi:MoaA/NifB/PqqE/SkfB family radical SAM enzyme
MFSSVRKLFRELRVVTFFVTYRCNARCRTCFYWQELNNKAKKELSLEEIERLAQTMPPFPHLLLSGGEPFLRADLLDLIRIFARRGSLATLDIPTNGTLADRTLAVARAALEQFPALRLTIGVSLDGLEATHDSIRGVPGSFKKAVALLDALETLRDEIQRKRSSPPQLQVHTLSVMTAENAEELSSLADSLSKHPALDGMMFEALRGEPPDKSLKPPPIEQFDRIVAGSLAVNDVLFARRYPQERATRLSYVKSVYQLQRECLSAQQAALQGGAMPARRGGSVPCKAGRRLAVIEPNGDVRLCELLPAVGNVRDYDYDFAAVWTSAAARKQRRWIAATRCTCTHCVNLGHSIDDFPSARRARLAIERALTQTDLACPVPKPQRDRHRQTGT